jgi:hypothetical protein
VEALRNVGAKDVSYIRIEGAGHGVFNQHAARTHTAMEEFFARTIGDTRPQPAGASRKEPAFKRTSVQEVKQYLALLGEKGLAAGSPQEIAEYERVFHSLDLDKDQKLTKTEYIEKGRYGTVRMRTGIFRATDRNTDGILTKREYVDNRIITDEAKRIFATVDADNDRSATADEFVAALKTPEKCEALRLFKLLDINADGTIGMIEYLIVLGDWTRRATRRIPLSREKL